MSNFWENDVKNSEKHKVLDQLNEDVVELLKTSLVDATLEDFQALTDVGVGPSCSSNDGTLFYRKMRVQFRHPDLPTDVSRVVTLRLSVHPPFVDYPYIESRQVKTESFYYSPFHEKRLGRSFEVLLIEIYDDEDPLILFEFRLTSRGFDTLRQEQRLLVDFHGFPDILIQLLEKCDGLDESSSTDVHPPSPVFPHEEDQQLFGNGLNTQMPPKKRSSHHTTHDHRPRRETPDKNLVPLLICHVSSSIASTETPQTGLTPSKVYRKPESVTFTIVETNNFRELTHLLLVFFPATQDAVITHLSERLKRLKTYSLGVKKKLEKTCHLYKTIGRDYLQLRQRLQDMTAQSHSWQDSLKKTLEENISKTHQEADLKLRNAEMMLQQSFDEKENLLRQKQEALELENRSLVAQVQSLQQKLDLSTLAEQTAQEEKASLTEAVTRLTDDLTKETQKNSTLMTAKKELEEECRSLCSRVAADQKEIVALKEHEKEFQEDRTAVNLLRERESQLCLALRASAAEISKGNQVIETLQQALRRERNKHKQFKASIHQDTIAGKKDVHETLVDCEPRQRKWEQREENLTKEIHLLHTQLERAHQSLQRQALDTTLTDPSFNTLLHCSSSYKSDPLIRPCDHLSSLPIPPPQATPVVSAPSSANGFPKPKLTGSSVQHDSAMTMDSLTSFHLSSLEASPYPAPKPIRITKERNVEMCVEEKKNPSIQQCAEPTLLYSTNTKSQGPNDVMTHRSTDTDVSFGQSDLVTKDIHRKRWSKDVGSSSGEEASLGYSLSTFDSAPHFGSQHHDSPRSQ